MKRIRLLAFVVCPALCGDVEILASVSDSPPVRIIETEEGFQFLEGDTTVCLYQRKPTSFDGKCERANYVHPLYDLNGHLLTEDFPEDHRHHRGIFWAWHQVWVGQQEIGDPWLAKDFSWDVRETQLLQDDSRSTSLRVQVLWQSPQWLDDAGMQKPLVRETTTIRVHQAEGDTRKIDFDIRLLALEQDVRLGGSDDDKGYGGFSVRVRLPKDVRFVGQNGAVEPQRTAVNAGPWLDVSGTYGEAVGRSGVTILCHPSLPGFPQQWILRKSRSMQNPVYPGREAIHLSTETPLVMRYRLVLHRGEAQPEEITQWHAEYCNAVP